MKTKENIKNMQEHGKKMYETPAMQIVELRTRYYILTQSEIPFGSPNGFD